LIDSWHLFFLRLPGCVPAVLKIFLEGSLLIAISSRPYLKDKIRPLPDSCRKRISAVSSSSFKLIDLETF